jgi:hypothetical protein
MGRNFVGPKYLRLKMSDFRDFGCFCMKTIVSECVLRFVRTFVDVGDSIGSCDSKTARKDALFCCPVGSEMSSELAVVESMGGCKTMSLGVAVLV